MTSITTRSDWYRDNYLISTNASLIQPAAINEAFADEKMYWVNPLEEKALKHLLDKSLCFGVYELPSSSSAIAGRGPPRQIGLGRLITDEVSFAYLTDVYILEEHRGKGLGTWLLKCINDTLNSWPHLRGFTLFSGSGSGIEHYEKHLGVNKFVQGKNDLFFLHKKGPGSAMTNWDT